MATVPQIHHGLHVADLALTKAALRAIGYTATQPGAAEPIELRNVPEDPVGQQTASVLGDRYVTHFIENPRTGHQIDLIQIEPQFLTKRLSREPMQGDLTIGVPVEDPWAAYATFRAADPRGGFSEPVPCPQEDGIRFFGSEGQDFIFTRKPAFAIVHYSDKDFPITQRLFRECYGFPLIEMPSSNDNERRFRAEGVGGRLEFAVHAAVARPNFALTGKHYVAANHYRLLNVDLARVKEGFARTGLGGFLLGPYPNGFAFTYGPTNETVELYDLNMMVKNAA